jgi:hypothetical protein
MRRLEKIKQVLTDKRYPFHVYNEGEDGFHLSFIITDRMYCIVASWGMGWDHVSLHTQRTVIVDGEEKIVTILPLWDDMCIVREIFFHPDEWVMQLHPPIDKNISVHNDTLHLWRPQRKPIPKPPKEMV